MEAYKKADSYQAIADKNQVILVHIERASELLEQVRQEISSGVEESFTNEAHQSLLTQLPNSIENLQHMRKDLISSLRGGDGPISRSEMAELRRKRYEEALANGKAERALRYARDQASAFYSSVQMPEHAGVVSEALPEERMNPLTREMIEYFKGRPFPEESRLPVFRKEVPDRTNPGKVIDYHVRVGCVTKENTVECSVRVDTDVDSP